MHILPYVKDKPAAYNIHHLETPQPIWKNIYIKIWKQSIWRIY